jgi:hypothetical protein
VQINWQKVDIGFVMVMSVFLFALQISALIWRRYKQSVACSENPGADLRYVYLGLPFFVSSYFNPFVLSPKFTLLRQVPIVTDVAVDV